MTLNKFNIIENFRNKRNDSIIFFLVSLFAFHGFYFIHVFAVNTIVGDEFNFLPFVKSFVNGGEFWKEEFFLQYDLHRLIIPNFIILISVFFTKWNTIYLMYFGWILISFSTVFIFLMIKKTFPQVSWIIIPIAAILYSPIHYGTFLWALPNTSYLLILCGFTGSIYFLNKVQDTKLFIFPAIFFAIIAMFSSFTGMIIWAVGILSLLNFNKFGKYPLLIWIFSGIILSTLYFVNFTLQTVDEPVLIKNESYTMNFLEIIWIFFSKGFVNNISLLKPLEVIVGSFVFITIILGPTFLKLKKFSLFRIMPWIQFGIIGLIISFGFYVLINFSNNRITIDAPVYSIFANFPQISAIVIITIILMFYKNNLKNNGKKNISLILLILLFSSFSVGLSASYYVGWWHGFQTFDERIQYQKCLLDADHVSTCLEPGVFADYIEKNKPILNELKLGPFANQLKFNDHSNDPLLQFLHVNIVGKSIQVNHLDYLEPREDGTLWNDSNNVIFDYNAHLQINLDKQYFSKEVELSLDSNDTYSVKFFNGEFFLGREIIYTETNFSGLRTYDIQISDQIYQSGYDKIQIQPLSGDDHFSFGHIMINSNEKN